MILINGLPEDKISVADRGLAYGDGVFLVLRQGVLLTPDLSRCGVAGVTRERILAWAKLAGIPAKIQDIPLDALWDAKEVMVCNSLIGIWQVREIETSGRIWGHAKLTPLIRQSLAECYD